ncbi:MULTISPECIES: AraC family transcriptional regulator [unclassified Streptomyces]|uniref:AraC family transcriptional regulator n=1 Tax=unclassified Streptomyces TaxID=2593676 RepID=UPI002E183113
MAESVALQLDQPPEVVSAGVGVHGGQALRESFRLPDLWQLHLYSYAGELTVDGLRHPIRPGHISLIRPDTEAHFRYASRRSEHLYAHFRLPGRDPQGLRRVPVMQDAGAQAALLGTLLGSAVAAMPLSRARASAEVWTVLWHTTQLGPPERTGRPHPALAAATEYIERSLATPLTVPGIAAAAGVSPGHLTRLFRADTGDTVVAWIRRRRMERARHLLQSSTLAITAVAATVGIPDLQAFNKACRRELGASPREVRGRRRVV